MALRVAVTRASEDAEPLGLVLSESGFDPVFVPLMTRAALPGALDGVENDGPWDVLLLTSPAAALAAQALPPTAIPPRVGCVGPATAHAAASLERPIVVPAVHTGPDLIALLDLGPSDRTLWIRGRHTTEATHAALVARGVPVRSVIAYATRPDLPAARRALQVAGPIERVTLTSPRFAEAWATLVDGTPTAGVPVVCIGPSTADAATARGLSVAAVADPHDLRGLVDAVRASVG